MTRIDFLRPSSAATWVKCQGSVHMREKFRDATWADSEAAQEGTAAHWVASTCLYGKEFHPVPTPGDTAPNGVVIDDDMVEHAFGYRDYVHSLKGQLFIERQVDLSRLYPGLTGTPDAAVLSGDTVRVVDYKYGHGYVEEFENWQLLCYCAGYPTASRYELTVYQPRCYGMETVRTWRISRDEIEKYWNRLSLSAHKAMASRPDYVVNRGCGYCTGRHACNALQMSAMDAVYASAVSIPVDADVSAQAVELRLLNRAKASLDARVGGLEASLLAHITSGESVPGFHVARSAGRQVWKRDAPVSDIISAASMFGADIARPGLDTPKQAIKKGVDKGLVDMYSEHTSGAIKLAEDDDKSARKSFSGNENGD